MKTRSILRSAIVSFILAAGLAAFGTGFGSAADNASRSFNPQPDPPGAVKAPSLAFNPQPDPPGRSAHRIVVDGAAIQRGIIAI
jgi:hypothetical protein